MKRTLKLNKDLQPCSNMEFKEWRDFFINEPICIGDYGFFDVKSIGIMEEYIKAGFTDKKKVLDWKLASNAYITFTAEELTTIYGELISKFNERRAGIFLVSRKVEESGKYPLLSEVRNPAFWA